MSDAINPVTNYSYSYTPSVSIKTVSASKSSPAISQEGMAFLTMMALGKKGDDKVSTMERMALMAMLLQKKKKWKYLTYLCFLPATEASTSPMLPRPPVILTRPFPPQLQLPQELLLISKFN